MLVQRAFRRVAYGFGVNGGIQSYNYVPEERRNGEDWLNLTASPFVAVMYSGTQHRGQVR